MVNMVIFSTTTTKRTMIQPKQENKLYERACKRPAQIQTRVLQLRDKETFTQVVCVFMGVL